MEDMRTCLAMHPDATPEEKADLKRWVKDGNSPWDNPSYLYDDYGRPMDFIEGSRVQKEMDLEFEQDPVAFLRRWGIAETENMTEVIEPEFDPWGDLPF